MEYDSRSDMKMFILDIMKTQYEKDSAERANRACITFGAIIRIKYDATYSKYKETNPDATKWKWFNDTMSPEVLKIGITEDTLDIYISMGVFAKYPKFGKLAMDPEDFAAASNEGLSKYFLDMESRERSGTLASGEAEILSFWREE